MAKITTRELIFNVVGIVIGVTLIPLLNTAIASANITDPVLSAVVYLIPIVYVFALVVNILDGLF